MRRAIVVALTANVILLTSSVAVITWATADVPGSGAPTPHRAISPVRSIHPGAAASADYAAVASVPAPRSDLVEVVGVLPPASPDVATIASPERLSPQIHRTAEIPARPRHGALRDFRAEFSAGLATLQQRVSGCALSGASFALALESVAGGVRIVSATVDSAGASDASAVACGEAALRGQFIPTENIEPGKRWKIPFAVDSSI